ncbi:MAG: tyrosine-type recombinase/integrase [Pirellulaceae bacterium]
MTFWGVQSIFRTVKERRGVTRMHAHLLRHDFAMKALANGAGRGVGKDMMGHAITAMTNRYLGEERKAQAAREVPRYSRIWSPGQGKPSGHKGAKSLGQQTSGEMK